MKIKIHRVGQDKLEIEAELVAPGLAVHKAIDQDYFPIKTSWRVTHVRSGMALGKPVPTRKDAIAIAGRLAELGNWDVPESKLGKQMRQRASEIVKGK